MESVIQDTQMWTQTNFARAELGDVRRTKRLMILAAQVAADPSASLPEQTGTWNDLRAAYNLFDCEDVTFEAIAAPHWEQTKTTRSEILLILEDTTEIDYSLNRKIKDLSPVGSGTRQGFHLHSGLMVSAEDDRIHGLAGQLIYHRQHISKGETRTERLQRDDRESQIWCKLVDQIGSPPPGSTWVHVVDRGADDFEFFYHCQQTQTEWVVRAKNLHRTIITPNGTRQELYTYLHTLPEAGSFTLELRARPNQPARTAKLVVSFGALSMPMPALTSPAIRKLKPAPIPMYVVWVARGGCARRGGSHRVGALHLPASREPRRGDGGDRVLREKVVDRRVAQSSEDRHPGPETTAQDRCSARADGGLNVCGRSAATPVKGGGADSTGAAGGGGGPAEVCQRSQGGA